MTRRCGTSDRRGRRQRGIAIIAVMGLASVVAVMAAHVVMLSQTAAMEAVVSSERSRLRYVCESAADYAFWSFLCDRREFSDRNYKGDTPDPEDTGIRWQTFGANRRHVLTYEGAGWVVHGAERSLGPGEDVVQVSLSNADVGVDFGGLNPGVELLAGLDEESADMEQQEEGEAIRILLEVARDYADPDDQLHGPHGMEREDYEQWGFSGLSLPRNAPIQYAEEVYWYLALCDESPVAEYRDIMRRIVLDQGGPRLLPPLTKGFKWPKQSVFSASPRQLMQKAGLQSDQAQQAQEAIRNYETAGVLLETTLDPEVMGRLRTAFLLGEIDVVTFAVAVSSEAVPGMPMGLELRVTRCARAGQPASYADKGKESWLLWDRSFRRDPFAAVAPETP